jgi:hypothetical protein
LEIISVLYNYRVLFLQNLLYSHWKNSIGMECSRIYETERRIEKEGKERKGRKKNTTK